MNACRVSSARIHFFCSRSDRIGESFADYFDQHALRTTAVEFAVEDLFPWPEVELALRDGHDYLAPHDRPLEMSVRVVLASSVVGVSRRRSIERRECLQPFCEICLESILLVVDENRGGYVH